MALCHPTFVLDACVAAKWFFEENLSESALVFLRRIECRTIKIVVPEIFYSEVASVCLKNVRRKEVSLDQSAACLDYLIHLPIETFPHKELVDVALEDSFRFKISFYDALYLVLAEMYMAPFVTADKPLFEACKKRFDFIEYLGDIRVP